MPLDIAIVLYDGMTTLDAIGPMEVLRFLPGARLLFVADDANPVTTDVDVLELGPTVAFDQVPAADVIVVPGGPGTAAALAGPLVPWLRAVHPSTRWTTSVCSGSLLLGAADLLRGAPATSHFTVREHLVGFGATPTAQRVVVDADRHVITAAGVSAGIDMALALAELLTDADTADAIQLIIEYDPRPARRAGTLETAPPAVVARAVELGRPHGAIPEGWAPGRRPPEAVPASPPLDTRP